MGANWSSVSRREAEVLEAVRERLTNAEIAARFFISERTVESHVSSLLRKLGAQNRSELVKLAPPAATLDRSQPRLPGQVEVLIAAPCVGRGDDLDRLRRLWSRAAAGQSVLGLVTGDAGVGKTRLVAELAAQVHRDGASVMWGACLEDVQAPYQPLTDALEAQAALLASGALDEELGASGVVLAQVLGLLGRTSSSRAQAADALPDTTQLWLSLRRLLHWLASKAPVLLVIDDLHWAADSTREMLFQLVRSADPVPLLVIGTARDTRPDVAAGTDLFLSRCERLPNSERVTLRGLGTEAIADLLASLGSDADAAQVTADTGGNPLLARESVRSDTTRGNSLAALLAPRYERLSDEASSVLDAATVLGAAFEAVQIAGVVDRPVMQVVQALEEAEAAGLVVPIPDRAGRFAFVHPLFRTLHYENLRTSSRLQLHHRAAVHLERAAADERVLAALAHHACIAAPVGDPRTAIRFACEAAAVAERFLALDEAAHHYDQALTVASLLPEDPRLRMRLTISLGRTRVESGDVSGRRSLVEAASWAREVGDGEALAEIAWALVPFGRPPAGGAADPEFVAIAEDALSLLGDDASAPRVRVLAALSTQLSASGEPARGYELVEECVRIARTLDDRSTLATALLAQRFGGGLPLRPEDRLTIAEELMALGARLNARAVTMNGLYTQAWSLRELGALARHDRAIDALSATVGGHPAPTFTMLLLLLRAVQDFLRGELDAADNRVGEAFQLAPDDGWDPVAVCGPVQFMVIHARGQVGAIAPVIEASVANEPGFQGAYEALLALSYAHAGRLDDAKRVIDAAAASQFASLQPNIAYTTGLALYAEATEVAGTPEAARRLLDLLQPFSGMAVDNGTSFFETIDLAIAKAALAASDFALARASAERVLASEIGQCAPVVRGRALIRLAAAEGAIAGSVRDEPVREALAIAERTGALVIAQDAERLGL